jgi:hypothetical protein
MPFYRYVDPTYGLLGGAFPGAIGGITYGRINVTSGGVGGGDGSAIVGGAKVGAPNAGTLLVAFGEQGLSQAVNRGLGALAQNTDVLDNVQRSNIPAPTYTDGVSGVGITTISLAGDVWTGSAADWAALTVDGLITLISPSTGRALRDAGGNVLTVASIELPALTVQFRQGFITNPIIRLSGTLPANTPWRLWWYGRSSLAKIAELSPSDWVAWVMLMLGMAGRNALHSVHGLDEKYRRASLPAAGALPDTAGNGAQILRDGQALEVIEPDMDYTAVARPDPFLSLFKASRPTTLTGSASSRKGAIGFLSTTTRALGGETGNPDGYASFASLMRRNVASDDISGVGLTLTRVPVGAPVRLNPGGLGSARVSLFSYPSHYWRKNVGGIDRTSIVRSHDLLLVTRANGDKQLYYIVGFVDNQVASVTPVTGSGGYFTTPDEVATVELFHASFRIDQDGRLIHVALPVSGGGTDVGGTGPALFVSSSRTRVSSGFADEDTSAALAWGAQDEEDGTVTLAGSLRGDGGMYATYAYAPHVDPVVGQDIATPTTGTANYDPVFNTKSSSAFRFNVTGVGTSQISILMANPLALEGHHITVVVHTVAACTIDMDWDGGSGVFMFSGNDGSIVDQVAGATYMWEGKSMRINGTYRFLMKRTDY